MLSILASKGLVLGVLFTMTFCLGLIPVRLMSVIQRSVARSGLVEANHGAGGSRPRLALYKRVLSFLSCFAAGVFLATCFLDLLPGVRKKLMSVLFRMNIISGFPLAEFIMSLGLFFILIVEQIVLLCKETSSSATQRKDENTAEDTDVRKPLLGRRGDRETGDSSESEDQEFQRTDHTIGGITDQPDISNSVQDLRARGESDTSHHHHHRHHHHHHNDHHHHHHHHDEDLQNHSPLRALMLVVALSLHSVFEGLAVGLQSSTEQVLGIFAALVLHKSILSFSIGLSLVQSRLSLAVCLRSVLFFSLTAPVGVGIGMAITYFGASATSDLADGVLTGMASGTFLYMTFFEVLPAEFNNHHDRMLKLLMLLLGFGTVAGILFLSDDVKAPFCTVTGDG